MHRHKILKKRNLNHNVIELTVDSNNIKFNAASFIYIYKDFQTMRPYTPIYASDKIIIFSIKIYPCGELSQFINSLSEGEYIMMSEVIQKFRFDKNYKKILMIAGGTGVTPMLQMIEYAPDCEYCLIFCNKSREDIFWRIK